MCFSSLSTIKENSRLNNEGCYNNCYISNNNDDKQIIFKEI